MTKLWIAALKFRLTSVERPGEILAFLICRLPLLQERRIAICRSVKAALTSRRQKCSSLLNTEDSQGINCQKNFGLYLNVTDVQIREIIIHRIWRSHWEDLSVLQFMTGHNFQTKREVRKLVSGKKEAPPQSFTKAPFHSEASEVKKICWQVMVIVKVAEGARTVDVMALRQWRYSGYNSNTTVVSQLNTGAEEKLVQDANAPVHQEQDNDKGIAGSF